METILVIRKAYTSKAGAGHDALDRNAIFLGELGFQELQQSNFNLYLK